MPSSAPMHRFERQELKESQGSLFADEVAIRFQDVDAAGSLFFARLFDYLHGAYEGLLESAGCPLPLVLAEKSWAAPLRHVEADYFGPLTFGDRVVVHIALAHVEETEITLGYRVVKEDESVAAVGQTVHTFIDVGSRTRRPVPPELTRLLTALVN